MNGLISGVSVGGFMKIFAIITLAILPLLAQAQEITVDEYRDLWKKYKTQYEEVTPGMTAEYRLNYLSVDENQNEVECFEHMKEVVISTERLDKYLVYRKITKIGDCAGKAPEESDMSEFLFWRTMDYVDVPFSVRIGNNVVHYSKITLNRHFTHAEGTRRDNHTEEDLPYMVKRDFTKSQFYNLVEEKWGNHTQKLLKRSYTNPDSIPVETLEIIN